MKSRSSGIHNRSIGGEWNPSVSVVVPAYNVSKYVEATLSSLAVQTFRDFEVIVVDDASTDDTVALVERWDDPRLRLLRHTTNEGVASARNTAFNHARGKYIALLDPDDVAFPDRIARQVEELNSDLLLGMVGASDAVMDEAGVATGRIWRHPTDPIEANVGMFFDNSFSTSTLMIRAEALAGKRYLPMRISEDYEFNARIAREWKVKNLKGPLVWRRKRRDGLTATMPSQMLQSNRRIIREHLDILAVQPTEREIELCLHLGKHHLVSTLGLLDEIDDWLTRLCNANETCGRFVGAKFNSIIARQWFETCKRSSVLGPAILQRYSRSKLASYGNINLKDWVRFIGKCVTRHRR
jgi:glycosyltransferase involved in cell wall biosynthesis